MECGTYTRFHLKIDNENSTVTAISFTSNGCGYMVAAAEIIAASLEHRTLTDLHGLDQQELTIAVERELSGVPPERAHCLATVVHAVRESFAAYRRSRIEEFHGERALVCTCFGISEDTIEAEIRAHPGSDVDDIGRLTNAGTGCGSCRFLIGEMIDAAML